MKVIEQNQAGKWTRKVTCTGHGNGGRGCKSVLEISKDDLFLTGRGSYDGSYETFVTFRCCVCCELTDVASSEDPSLDKKREINIPGLPTKKGWYESHGIPYPEG